MCARETGAKRVLNGRLAPVLFGDRCNGPRGDAVTGQLSGRAWCGALRRWRASQGVLAPGRRGRGQCARAGRHAPDRPQEPRHLRPRQHHQRTETARGRVQASRPPAPPARPYYAVVRRTRRRGGAPREIDRARRCSGWPTRTATARTDARDPVAQPISDGGNHGPRSRSGQGR